jgi:hypothetical protein
MFSYSQSIGVAVGAEVEADGVDVGASVAFCSLLRPGMDCRCCLSRRMIVDMDSTFLLVSLFDDDVNMPS